MRFTVTTLLYTLIFALFGTTSARSDDKLEAEKELKKFQGTWSFASIEAGGKQLPSDSLRGMTVLFEGNRYTVKSGEAVAQIATQKLDVTTSPKAVDIRVTEGPNRGTILLGIYEISDETLRVCFDPEGKKRPTDFKTTAGSATTLVVHKRIKK